MTDLLEAGAVLLVVGGLVVLVLASSTHQWRDGVRSMLDLWLAAALLGLATGRGGAHLAAAAAVLVLRRLAALALRPGGRAHLVDATAG